MMTIARGLSRFSRHSRDFAPSNGHSAAKMGLSPSVAQESSRFLRHQGRIAQCFRRSAAKLLVSRLPRSWDCLLRVVVCLFCLSIGSATAVRAAEPGSLDEHLLGEVPAAPGAGVDADLFRDAEETPPAPGIDAEPLDRRLQRELGQAGVSEDAHPLLAIARQMRDVQARLARQGADAETAALQHQIVAQLDKLLEQARSQASAAGESQRQAPPSADRQPGGQPDAPSAGDDEPQRGPTREATDEPGEAESIDEPLDPQQALQAMERLWNRLPERQREQLLQLAPEHFLPKYQSEIEQYFRRLSEP